VARFAVGLSWIEESLARIFVQPLQREQGWGVQWTFAPGEIRSWTHADGARTVGRHVPKNEEDYIMPLSRLWGALLLPLAFASITFAQSTPTNNVLTRMTIIKSRYGSGTAFSIDVDQREYWITAKHILTGAKHPPYGVVTRKSESLSLLDPGAQEERWTPVKFFVIDAGKDIDIVILAPPTPVLRNPLPSVKTTLGGTFLGGDCEFLGFPSATGSAWAAPMPDGKFYWMPYVKHCYVSSLPSVGTRVLVLDGVNNPGFSGGPVVSRTGPDQQIIAVVSGIVTEPSEVLPSLVPKKPPNASAQQRKEKVEANSGFIIAYAIDSAIEAIRKNPIGPERH
jgi:hypothetical protein